MQCTIGKVYSTVRRALTIRTERKAFCPLHHQPPNEMQYTIGKLYSRDRKGT